MNPWIDRCRRAWHRRAVRWAAYTLLLLGGFAAVLAAMLLQAVRPAPGEWSTELRLRTPLGVLRPTLSMPVLLRWGTHPLAGLVLEGRTLDSAAGAWRLHFTAIDTVEAECRPCSLSLQALGDVPLPLTRARLHIKRLNPEQWEGELLLGDGGTALHLPWRAQLAEQQVDVQARLEPAALADALMLFGDAVPERQQAHVEGQVALRLEASWSAQGWALKQLHPALQGVEVAGLGTEALIDAAPPPGCPAPRGGRIEGWLPHAIVAAEDPHFYERSEVDAAAWPSAWTPAGVAAAGPSLGERLARRLFVGDAPGPAQDLRAWLYAAEMERTLDKGRILQSYLAVAAWGDGVCGAEAAARHYLRKDPQRLAPHEAAWLASLLDTADGPAAEGRTQGGTQRAVAILTAMPRLPRERQQQAIRALAGWTPLATRTTVSNAPASTAQR